MGHSVGFNAIINKAEEWMKPKYKMRLLEVYGQKIIALEPAYNNPICDKGNVRKHCLCHISFLRMHSLPGTGTTMSTADQIWIPEL